MFVSADASVRIGICLVQLRANHGHVLTGMNKKRRSNAVANEDEYLNPEVWASMTDKENKRFRYSY